MTCDAFFHFRPLVELISKWCLQWFIVSPRKSTVKSNEYNGGMITRKSETSAYYLLNLDLSWQSIGMLRCTERYNRRFSISHLFKNSLINLGKSINLQGSYTRGLPLLLFYTNFTFNTPNIQIPFPSKTWTE